MVLVSDQGAIIIKAHATAHATIGVDRELDLENDKASMIFGDLETGRRRFPLLMSRGPHRLSQQVLVGGKEQ